MSHPLLPKAAASILRHLFASVPPPRSVWLFGSRANGRATVLSDTDLLVFADEAFIDSLLSTLSPPEDVDILVVTDGDTIKYPWKAQEGSLKSWCWSQRHESEASYVGRKFYPETDFDEGDREEYQRRLSAERVAGLEIEEGNGIKYQERAIRLYPNDA